MKRILASLILILALALSAFGQGSAGPVLGGTNYSNLSSAFVIPSVSWAATGLTLTYTNGAVYQAGNANPITGSTLTVTTSKGTCTQAGVLAGNCNIVYWASGPSLSTTTSYATAAAAGNRILYFVATSAGGNITGAFPIELDTYGPIPPTYVDGAIPIGPSAVSITATTTSCSSQGLVRAAANNTVYSCTTNTTAGTLTTNWDISFEGRTTSGLGFQVTSIELLYGVQTTALSSIAAATLATITYPAAGGAASGTVAAVGGTLTVTPTTLQTATTTSGQCYHESLSLQTPITLADMTRLNVEQAFTTAGSTATTLQVCGAILHGNWIQ